MFGHSYPQHYNNTQCTRLIVHVGSNYTRKQQSEMLKRANFRLSLIHSWSQVKGSWFLVQSQLLDVAAAALHQASLSQQLAQGRVQQPLESTSLTISTSSGTVVMTITEMDSIPSAHWCTLSHANMDFAILDTVIDDWESPMPPQGNHITPYK